MESIKLPTEKAHEPVEEAHQPMVCDSGTTMSSQESRQKKQMLLTFAENTISENKLSQNSSAYKEALSQPAPGMSHYQRLIWLQHRRGPGLWVQCDACNSWRFLPHVVDSHQLPHKWYCSMNPDKALANCSAPETPLCISDDEELIHSEYSCGSLVWARLPGWPWWPAMVDDEPDTEQFYWLDGFSDIPTHYNVVFFDANGATRAWIAPDNLKPYTPNKKKFQRLLNSKQYKKRLEKAMKEADKAEKLPVADRLATFSFINTYKGLIVSPKKVSKRELEMYQNKLKRKYNVDFPIEASSESEDESIQALREINKKKNVILIGTPKSKKTKRVANSAKNSTDIADNCQGQEVNGDSKDKEESNKNGETCIREQPNWETNNYGNKQIESNNNDFPITKSSLVVRNMLSDIDNDQSTFKMPNSMVTEIGSTAPTLTMETGFKGFDNDSSKTYRPEEEESDVVVTQDFQIRAETPSSDDFDF